MIDRPPLRRGYRYEWSLFADWCAAVDLPALPASPVTLALFLTENPAGVDAVRRRVAMINRAHRDAGTTEPGTVTAIRLQLEHSRARSTDEVRRRVAPLIAALPTMGWPTGMFARRDAMILSLRTAGLRAADIAALDRRDVFVERGALHIGGRHHLHLSNTDTGASDIDYVSVWRNWEKVLYIVDRHPSTRVLEQYLRTDVFPASAGSAPHVDGPVVVPIDRWGAVPLPLTAMTQVAVSTVVTAHRTGTAPAHRSITGRRHHQPPNSIDEPTIAPPAVASSGGPLDDTYAAGVAARLAAHTTLADVSEVFDDVEARADELLRRTLALLDSM